MTWEEAKETEVEILNKSAISNGILPEKVLVKKDVENAADEAVAVEELT